MHIPACRRLLRDPDLHEHAAEACLPISTSDGWGCPYLGRGVRDTGSGARTIDRQRLRRQRHDQHVPH